MTSAYVHALENTEQGMIIITGAGKEESLNRFTEQLQVCENKYDIQGGSCICTSSATVSKIAQASGVILFEELGCSNKMEIQKEIERVQQLGKKIYGIVLQK